MTEATGIPPHVGTAQQLAKFLDVLTDLVQKFGEHGKNLMEAVKEALDTKAWESGHVTGSQLKEILENSQRDSVKVVESRLESCGLSSIGQLTVVLVRAKRTRRLV
jgi:hypothetical protein